MNAQIKEVPSIVTEIAEYSQTAAADMRIRNAAHEMLAALKDVHPHISDDALRARIGNLIAKVEGV